MPDTCLTVSWRLMCRLAGWHTRVARGMRASNTLQTSYDVLCSGLMMFVLIQLSTKSWIRNNLHSQPW
jgi:hypothetical protein